MTVWTIKANYDPDAQVWYSIEGDMPGLNVEGDTIDQLAVKASGMLIDLLEINADLFPADRLRGAHAIHIIAHDERTFSVAA